MNLNLGSWKEPAELDSPVFTMPRNESFSKNESAPKPESFRENRPKHEEASKSENISKPDDFSKSDKTEDSKERNYPKKDIMGILSSLIGSGGFDISSLLNLLGGSSGDIGSNIGGNKSSLLAGLLPLLLNIKKPAQDSTGSTINFSDYKRVK